MKTVVIKRTETYKKQLNKFSKKEQEIIEKKVDSLKENPKQNPTRHINYPLYCLHVLKNKYRVYYLIKEDEIEIVTIITQIIHKKHLKGKYSKELPKILDSLKKYLKS